MADARVKYPKIASNPPEATEADADEYGLGDPTTKEDNTPSVILATMLEAPAPKKDLRDISGRERPPTVVDRPRPGGGVLLTGPTVFVKDTFEPLPRTGEGSGKSPLKKGTKIMVDSDDDMSEIPQSWKDYL
jgi:hypothetical protein